ncbi:MAG: lytic transglycosylase domain-containing protein [Oligoflexales bacterium]|nr:lytic transglycosylase domain-containing protein [Oligoflexales bacterium]
MRAYSTTPIQERIANLKAASELGKDGSLEMEDDEQENDDVATEVESMPAKPSNPVFSDNLNLGKIGEDDRFTYMSVDSLYGKYSSASKDQMKITDNFSIPVQLINRVVFWYHVYTTFTRDDYIIHIGEYPEVILEVAELKASDNMGFGEYRTARKDLKDRVEDYVSILEDLQDYEPNTELSETEKRICGLMAHINDKDKYAKAAASIRVQLGQGDYIEEGFQESLPYLPAVKDAFKKMSLPEELVGIAYVESSFNIKAVSNVGASGVFQFMPYVGRHYMIVNHNIDERRDPIKSASAAAQLLWENFDALKSWPLAITAYNHGASGIKRGVSETGSSDIETLVQNYHNRRFGFASKNYYTEFLAMLVVVKQFEEAMNSDDEVPPLSYAEHKIGKPESIQSILKRFGTDKDSLMALNPDLSKDFVLKNGMLPRNYIVKVPVPELTAMTDDEKSSGDKTKF